MDDLKSRAQALREEDNLVSNAIDIDTTDKIVNAPEATLEEVIASFEKFLVFENYDVVKIMLAVFVANSLGFDPVWLFLVGASASGKTEFINSLDKIPGTYMLSLVTPATFLSGFGAGGKGKREPSLLLRLPKKFIFLQKDFTTILTLRAEHRAEILGQLREIFDGKLVKETGQGNTKSWKGHAGFITGVTMEIENSLMTSSKYGDRFLYFRLPKIDEMAAMQKVSDTLFSAGAMREEIQTKVAGYLTSVLKRIPEKQLPIEQQKLTGLQNVMQFIVRARGAVTRDPFGNKEITSVNLPEGPMRFYKEILAVGQAMQVMNVGLLTESDYLLLTKLAFDSVYSMRVKVLDELYKFNDFVSTRDLAQSTHLPTSAARRVLEELEVHGLVERGEQKKGKPDFWFMPEASKKMMAYRYSSLGTMGEKIAPPISSPSPEELADPDWIPPPAPITEMPIPDLSPVQKNLLNKDLGVVGL